MNSLCDSVGSTSGFWVLVALAVNSRLTGQVPGSHSASAQIFIATRGLKETEE
jgi:hypothetical protein